MSDEFVWLEHETTGGKQRFPVEAADQWKGLGWYPTDPPPEPDLLHDPVLVDQVDDDAPRPSKATSSDDDSANDDEAKTKTSKASKSTAAKSEEK